jgi:hypothetical protein
MITVMKKHILTSAILGILALTAVSCNSDEFEKPDYYQQVASTKLGQQIVDGSSDYIAHVKKDVQTRVAPGVVRLDMGYLNQKGHAMQLFLYKVSLGPVSLIATAPKNGEKTELLTSMCTTVENQGKYTVLGAVCGGNALDKGDAFFATLKDGSAVCLPTSEYAGLSSMITMGYSGTAHLLQNGYVLGQADNATSARAAVGVSENGNEVYLLVVDGGDFFYSNGIGCSDLALLMKGCGAYDALALASGNPVTAVWRNMRSADLFDLLNKPANKGVEEPVAGGILIVQ